MHADIPSLPSVLQLMLLSQCGLDPRWMFQNDYQNLGEGDQFDFIVIGGGSAGAVVASRLSENEQHNVLLIEAGDYPPAAVEIPAFVNFLDGKEKTDWMYLTEPSNTSCLGFDGGRCRWPRGKVLGGTSCLNYMVYVRGLRQDYDGWRDLGNPGWGYDDVAPFFEKPPLKTSYAKAWDRLREVLLAGWGQAGYPVSEEREADTGLFEPLSTIHEGRRFHTAKAFLSELGSRKNLKVSVNTRALRILFSVKQAIGVEVSVGNKRFKLYAKKEVIVSGGTINSPQLLMLSGIGPQEHLASVGIEPLVNLPVGDNLQDHVLMRGIFVTMDPVPNNTLFENACYASSLYCAEKRGPLATVGTLNMLWFLNTENSTAAPNVQVANYHFPRNQGDNIRIYLINGGFDNATIEQIVAANLEHDIFNLLPIVARPESRGVIRLQSDDPFAKPLIYSGYFEDPGLIDLNTLIASIKHLKRLMATPAMMSLNPKFMDLQAPNCPNEEYGTRAFLECNIRNTGSSAFHPVGTCKMAPKSDPGAVVDHRLRVHGVTGLRVVDGSVMPVIINRNTNAACIMIGEKGAQMIKEDWP